MTQHSNSNYNSCRVSGPHSAMGSRRYLRHTSCRGGGASRFYACVRRDAATRLQSQLAFASGRARFWWSAGEKRGRRDAGRKTESGTRVGLSRGDDDGARLQPALESKEDDKEQRNINEIFERSRPKSSPLEQTRSKLANPVELTGFYRG